jgi:hypothetical protein
MIFDVPVTGKSESTWEYKKDEYSLVNLGTVFLITEK